MKNNRSPGPDGIPAEFLKAGSCVIIDVLTKLFNKIMKSGKVPSSWKESNLVLIHKKGPKDDPQNFRPISLLNSTYKIFMKVLQNRIGRTLEEHQPIEQAGFRSGFSTIDHIQTLRQLIEKHQEY